MKTEWIMTRIPARLFMKGGHDFIVLSQLQMMRVPAARDALPVAGN